MLGLILGGLYPAPVSFQGKAVSLEADGQIPCASRRGQPMASCNFSRRRHTQGDTSLQVIHPNGMERELVFQGGTFTGCQIGHDGCGELIVELAREEQLHLLRVGNERYEIPGGLLQGR